MNDMIERLPEIRKLDAAGLGRLASEVRERIIDVVSRNGGHLASSLGVVELTLALHHVFNTPTDRIIWDVGHQSYAHKIITGRDSGFESLRKLGGLSGFPKISESPFDTYNTGTAAPASRSPSARPWGGTSGTRNTRSSPSSATAP